eukprot:COSAG03_NODE_3707_length_1867_cov_1.754525_3_plen_36_part_00
MYCTAIMNDVILSDIPVQRKLIVLQVIAFARRVAA